MGKTAISVNGTTNNRISTEEVKKQSLFGFFLHAESNVLYFRHRKNPDDFLNVEDSDEQGGFRYAPGNMWIYLPKMQMNYQIPR